MPHNVTLCAHDLTFYFETDLNINTLNSENGVNVTNSATKI